jgi:hypothetical protein
MNVSLKPMHSVTAAALCAGLSMLFAAAPAAAQMVSIAPATRAESMQSPAPGLPDQQFQHLNLRQPLTTSLITVANLGGTGNRSFLVTVKLLTGGSFVFSAKEGGEDITLALSQPVVVSGVTVRCDSLSAVNCRYQISMVGD